MDKLSYYARFETEVIFLLSDEAETYVKSVPGGGYLAKFKGGKEFPIKSTSDVVGRAIDGMRELTVLEYENA